MRRIAGLLAASCLALLSGVAAAQVHNSGVTATPGQIPGTATGDNAGAGNLGESVSASGTAVALTTGAAANIASVSLTAGDWQVTGNVCFAYTTAGATSIIAWTSTTSATVPTVPNVGGMTMLQASFSAGATQCLSAGSMRISIAATTTVYLGGSTVFGSGTAAAYGFVGVRRVR